VLEDANPLRAKPTPYATVELRADACRCGEPITAVPVGPVEQS